MRKRMNTKTRTVLDSFEVAETEIGKVNKAVFKAIAEDFTTMNDRIKKVEDKVDGLAETVEVNHTELIKKFDTLLERRTAERKKSAVSVFFHKAIDKPWVASILLVSFFVVLVVLIAVLNGESVESVINACSNLLDSAPSLPN